MTDAGAAYVVFSKADQGTTDLNALGADGFRIGGESAAARTGWSVAGADLDSDGKAEVVASAIGARNAAGSTHVVKGRGPGADVDLGALGTQGFRVDGDAEDQSGWSVATGDVSGDGKADLLVGVPFHNPDGALMAGSVYVLTGGAMSANVTLANLGAAGYRSDGAKTQDGAGWSIAASPDLNGDILIGAPGADRPAIPQESIGAAYVVYGRATSGNVALALTRHARCDHERWRRDQVG